MNRLLLILSLVLFAWGCTHQDSVEAPQGQCVMCGADMHRLPQADTLECVFCRQHVVSDLCCNHGHFVCEDCHAAGVDSIFVACLNDSSSNAVEVFEHLVSMPSCHMHGPEHHIIVGAALLTAYHNAGGKVDLNKSLIEIIRRGKQVPGGACGNWGACGAALSAGMFVSIVTDNSPFATEAWHLSNLATAEALHSISQHGGPRCCKRDSYKALQSTTQFVKRELGVDMGNDPITCTRSANNKQCLGNACPYFPKNN